MADINGTVKARVTLTANEVQKITFEGTTDFVNLVAMGLTTGKIAVKVNADVANINDDTANLLTQEFNSIAIEEKQVEFISVVSDANTAIQWYISVRGE